MKKIFNIQQPQQHRPDTELCRSVLMLEEDDCK